MGGNDRHPPTPPRGVSGLHPAPVSAGETLRSLAARAMPTPVEPATPAGLRARSVAQPHLTVKDASGAATRSGSARSLTSSLMGIAGS